jgi:hypothetical protein
MAKQKMVNMTAYSNGYVPPKGSAGAAAFGDHSHKKNPMSVPRKGSSLEGEAGFGYNADRTKVMGLKREQAMKESLRGYPC